MKCDEITQAFSGKTILVAGGTGFIGKRLVDTLLLEGANVYVITRQQLPDSANLRYIRYDLTSGESLPCTNTSYDYGIYLAANIPLKGSGKESFIDAKKSTFDPFVRFCELFLKFTQKFIYASSIDVLGVVDTIEYDENATVNHTTPYGLAKYCGEFYAESICLENNIPYSTLRFSQVYGPQEPVVRIIPILLDCLMNNREFTLYTTGEEKRRFLYVDDAVQAILLACLYGKNGIYNIAGKESVSINDLITEMENIFGKKLNLKRLNNAKGKSNIPSIQKAQKILSYEPCFGIHEGLGKVREENERLQ